MKKLWIALSDRFDAMQPRERLMVFCAVIALILGVFYVFSLNPALERYQKARQQLAQDEHMLNNLAQEEVSLVQANARDPDAPVRQQIAAARAEHEAVQAALNSTAAGLTTPTRTVRVLRELISAQQGLTLVSMQIGEVQDLLAGLAPASAASAPSGSDMPVQGLFRHTLRMSLEGSYFALSQYVGRVEELPSGIRVGKVQIDAGQWPQARMELVLYINSLERAWLAF